MLKICLKSLIYYTGFQFNHNPESFEIRVRIFNNSNSK